MDPGLVAINIAYFFYVGATIPKRIIPLRVLLILASIAFVVYGLIDNNRSVIFWNLAFGSAQLYQLLQAVRHERSVVLTPEEEAVRSAQFSSLSPRDFLTFWSISEERRTEDEQLIVQDEPNETLVLMVEGTATISIDGKHIADRGPGNILGEASFITGDPASASVAVSNASVIRVWPHDKLEALTRAQPDVAVSLASSFARELTLKMKTTTS